MKPLCFVFTSGVVDFLPNPNRRFWPVNKRGEAMCNQKTLMLTLCPVECSLLKSAIDKTMRDPSVIGSPLVPLYIDMSNRLEKAPECFSADDSLGVSHGEVADHLQARLKLAKATKLIMDASDLLESDGIGSVDAVNGRLLLAKAMLLLERSSRAFLPQEETVCPPCSMSEQPKAST